MSSGGSTPTRHFYDLLADLAGFPGRHEAKRFAVLAVSRLLARLSRESAGLVAEGLPAPIPALLDSAPGAGLRFAPLPELVAEVAEAAGLPAETAQRRLRALGAALERTLTPEGLERLRAEVPQIARAILPSYRPVSSERPHVFGSAAVEPLCTGPIDPNDRTAYVRRRAS